ncbi:MAG: CHASE2 domain-containing protein [Candidatus Omnitrophica bacterium]|nr:CHASE2 domain-containing protein [Candidatus Omnitrophota bacterium]
MEPQGGKVVTAWKDDHTTRLTLLGIALTLLYLAVLCPLGFLEGARAASGDTLLQWRASLSGPPAQIQDFLLVTVDDESQRRLNQKWPWDRSAFAQFLRRITPSSPRMVLFDLAFVGQSRPESDQALAQAIREGPPTLLAAYLDPQGELMSPDPRFLEAGGIPGLINKPMDRDAVIRRMWTAIRLPGQAGPLYGIEVQAAARLWGIGPDQIRNEGSGLSLGSRHIPTGRLGELPINFLAAPEAFPAVSFWKALEGSVPSDQIRGKVVLVGSAREITHDVHSTPLKRMPGMVIEASGILTLMTQRFLTEFPLWAGLLICALFVVGILQIAYRATLWTGALAAAGLTGTGIAAAFFLISRDISVELLSPVLLGSSAWFTGFLYKQMVLTAGTLRLQRQAIRDGLTGAFTNRYFRLCLREQLQRAYRLKRPASLVLVQVPSQAQLLQSEPAEVAARRVKNLVDTLERALPAQTLVGRLREDRFGLFLPNTPLPRARELVAGLQAALRPGSDAVAFGLAGMEPISQETGMRDSLLQRAEAAVERAKVRGNGAIEEYDPALDPIRPRPPSEAETRGAATHLEYVSSELEERNLALERALAELRHLHEQLESSFLEVTKSLVLALETKDAYTAGHLERVSRYATRLAEVLDLPREEVGAIREAALLHDIGKIGLPDEVLHKVGRLTDEEREIIKQHLSIGAKILEPMKFFRSITTLIYHHHEWYNGQGYPHGLAGDFIPSGAQVIAIADAFDAMTTHRGYNKPMSSPEALAELKRGAGQQFNPLYVERFADLIVREGPSMAGYAAR